MVVFSFAILLCIPSPLIAQTETSDPESPTNTDDTPQRFEEVIKLRADGDYNQAIARLIAITQEYSDVEQVLRLAYTYLVVTYNEAGDTENLRETAREALGMYPDISANEIIFPSWVNETFDELRVEMYGSLSITEPEECRVFLDENYVGDTPLHIQYVAVGDHKLTVTKAGYDDNTQSIEIQSGIPLVMEVTMKRKHDKRWWGYRIGAGVVAAIGVAALAIGLTGQEEEPPPEPLPDPPAPPAN